MLSIIIKVQFFLPVLFALAHTRTVNSPRKLRNSTANVSQVFTFILHHFALHIQMRYKNRLCVVLFPFYLQHQISHLYFCRFLCCSNVKFFLIQGQLFWCFMEVVCGSSLFLLKHSTAENPSPSVLQPRGFQIFGASCFKGYLYLIRPCAEVSVSLFLKDNYSTFLGHLK